MMVDDGDDMSSWNNRRGRKKKKNYRRRYLVSPSTLLSIINSSLLQSKSLKGWIFSPLSPVFLRHFFLSSQGISRWDILSSTFPNCDIVYRSFVLQCLSPNAALCSCRRVRSHTALKGEGRVDKNKSKL